MINFRKRLAQAVLILGCLGALFLFCGGYQAGEESSALSKAVRQTAADVGFRRPEYSRPHQDADGYYLLETKEDFRWFIRTARENDPAVNVRLAADIALNDTKGWENWADTPPDYEYAPVDHYSGHFDGNGHALEGYYAVNGNWLGFLFTILEEDARITDLTIRNSLFQTTCEDCAYENHDGEMDVVTASALCYANYGLIENCHVEARVIGAWEAGGIVGMNYGQMSGCKFTGTVEAGADQGTEAPEKGLAVNTLYAGGICRYNQGSVKDCVNEGTVALDTLSDAFPVYDYAAGGIVGQLSDGGSIEACRNAGDVTSVQLAGGIAGASWGRIFQCRNDGNVHVEQVDREYRETLISAGICASNGGRIVNCLNAGAVTVTQKSLAFKPPVYGVACNTVNPDKGTIENSYYVREKAAQDYRLSGVNKLLLADEADFPDYISGKKKREERDGVSFAQYYDEEFADVAIYPLDKLLSGDVEMADAIYGEDVIHLGFGPKEDVTYVVQPGDSLWGIAKEFYGDGRFIGNILSGNRWLRDAGLQPGQEISVQHMDFAVYRRRDEEGFGISYWGLPSGERFPTRSMASKPIDWYYGTMRFEANAGLDTLWPKTQKDLGHFFIQADEIHVFCRLDVNPDGDFLEGRWEEARERITQSAAANCGESAECFEFKRYDMDNGESLYTYSFVLFKKEERLLCTVAYRLCDNLLAEFIGVEPLEAYESVACQDLRMHEVMARVPYMAAVVDTRPKMEEAQWDTEAFYGRENWPFPQLHNPFALARAYDRDAECVPYVLFTGLQ